MAAGASIVLCILSSVYEQQGYNRGPSPNWEYIIPNIDVILHSWWVSHSNNYLM